MAKMLKCPVQANFTEAERNTGQHRRDVEEKKNVGKMGAKGQSQLPHPVNLEQCSVYYCWSKVSAGHDYSKSSSTHNIPCQNK